MLTSELDILKPLDPSISNSDDYEIFTLSNAQVSYAKNGKQANLLAAYADTPLKVEGRLEAPNRSQLKYVIKKPFKPLDIEIRNVTRFSYGQTEDGEIVIWALGGAGWFELRPSKTYESIFNDMVEAVGILYFVTDIYNEHGKRGGPNVQLLFQQYTEDERFVCDDPVQASRIFQKHRAFLIMSFLNRAQGIAWSNTPLYQYLKKQFPRDWDEAKTRIEGRSSSRDKQEKPLKAESRTRTSKGKRDSKTTEKAPQAPKKDNNWWEASAIFEFMQKAVNQGVMRIGHITLDRLAKLLVRRYEIDDTDTARSVILVHAGNLCYMMDRPRKRTQFFVHEPIYEELSSGLSLSATEIKRAESVELKPRKDHSSLKDEISSDSDSAPSSLETPQRRPPHHKKGLLSVLRPTSGKFSGKSKGMRGKGKGKKPILDEDGSSGEEVESASSASNIEIDTPTQKLSPGKRKFVSDVLDTIPRKRAASGSPAPESPPESSDEADETGQALPLRWRNGNVPAKSSSPALIPPVVSTPLPEYTANAPGDSWICTFDGCSHKIFGVSTDVGRTLIKEHLEDHSKGRQKEVGLVLSEEHKLRLPVNNLLKRIRELTETQQSLFSSIGAGSPTSPTPIERKV